MSPRWATGAWLAFVVACAIIVSRTEISTDLSAFLPRSPTAAQQILVDQLRDGVVSRLILAGIEGAPPELLAQASRRMAAELRRQQDFASVSNGEDTGSEKDRDFLWRNRYLLSPAVTPDHFSPASLRALLEEDLRLLGSPAGIFLQRVLPADPTAELMRLLENLEGAARPDKRDGVWFARDGQRAILVAQTRAAGYDIDAQERAIAIINDAFAKAVSGAAAAPPRLVLSGPGVFSVSTRARIKHDALRFSVIATTLVGAMLLVLYRSMRVLMLGLLPVASGALAGIAAVSLGFGSVHGITLAFGATLIGEGVDYAIYLFTQTDREAPQSTLKRIWPTLRLGVATSICGFSALLFSGFPGLAQLGLFSIAGLLAAVIITRWMLPALMPAGFNARAAMTFAPQVSALVRGAAALRYAALVLVVLAAAFVVTRDAPVWSDDLASLSPIAPAEQKFDEQLRRDLGAPDVRHLIVLTARDEQAALEAAERTGARLQQAMEQETLEGFDSPATYLPSFAAQRARQAALPAPETLRENLQAALRGLPFRAGLFEPFLRDVATAKAQPLVDRSSLNGTSLALKVDSLLVARDGGWAAMLPLRGVRDAGRLSREVGGPQNTQGMLLDLKRESDELYRTYRREAVSHAALGLAAIVVLLLIALRSPRRVFWVLVPLAAAVIVTSSVILLTGSRLSIFHLIGLLLVVAVGSNYSLFFDRQAASLHERERTLVSLLFANIATVIGFGLLAFSKVPVLHAIGSTVGLGAVLSLVFSAAFIVRPPQQAAAA